MLKLNTEKYEAFLDKIQSKRASANTEAEQVGKARGYSNELIQAFTNVLLESHPNFSITEDNKKLATLEEFIIDTNENECNTES